MMEQRRPVIWPWMCVLLFCITLQLVSPPQWTVGVAQPRAAAPGQAVPHRLPPLEAVDADLVEPATVSHSDRVADAAIPEIFVSDLALGLDEEASESDVVTDEEGPALTLVSSEVSPRIATSYRAESITSALDLPKSNQASPRKSWPAQVSNATRIHTPSHLVRVPDTRTPSPAQIEVEPAAIPVSSAWLRPQELFDRLDRLDGGAKMANWSERVTQVLHKLTARPLPPAESATVLLELRGLADEATQRAAEPQLAVELASEWRRAQYALSRRLQIWQSALPLEASAATRLASHSGNPEQLASTVAGLEVVLARGSHQQKWREFLMVDALYDLSRRQDQSPLDERTLARRVLRRLERAEQDTRRREFLADAPLDELAIQLKSLAENPVDHRELLADVERFEQTMLPSDARYVADSRLRLISTRHSTAQVLARRIDENYRACNLRVAVTADLLNRLLPAQIPSNDPVRTTIVGLPVFGQSTTHTNISVRLVPDPRRMRLELVASGKVDASTKTSSGPVDVFNQSTSWFEARKPLEFTLRGVTAGPAQATANSNQRLSGLRTNYDKIPLVESVVRSMAMREHDEKHGQAKWESEQQVRQRAERQFDEASEPRLIALNKQLNGSVIIPMHRLKLQETPVLLETTAQRLVLRARLATDEQLAAHTPRSQAPADSLASLQLHQSAMNNILEQLGLGGQTFHAPDLMHHVAKIFNRDNADVGAEAPDRLRLTFAEQDAVLVKFQQGRVELVLRLAELVLDGKQWRDLTVRVGYVPESQGNRLVLVRDGSVSLSAERLNTRSQFILRGLFSRIFAEESSWTLLGDQWASNPRLRDTEFSQFTVEDGWISAALTPTRRLQATARKP